MPKLPGKRYSSAEPLDAADLLDVVVADENDCLLFEQRLNELVDLRCCVDEFSQDAHLAGCDDCQAMLKDYLVMLEATELLGAMSVENSDSDEETAVAAGRVASLGRLPADTAGSQFFGWSTLLAVLFVFWGASAGVPGNMRLTEEVLPTSTAGIEIEPAEFVQALNLAGLLEYPRDLVEYPCDLATNLVEVDHPLVRSAPASCQPFFEMPTGRLFAAALPAVDLGAVDIGRINYIGRYWQHASWLPGIEPWQHSVNFAIGWLNQPTFSNEKPQCI